MTSRDESNVTRLQGIVYRSLHAARGTCDDVEERTGLPHQSCSPRFGELDRMGRIQKTGERKRTRLGRWAAVWKVRK
jgi:hypothetical protein